MIQLEDELKAQRAENDAIKSRSDATVAGMRAGMARRDAEAATQETDAVTRGKSSSF
ncbi:MAG: hypothetical protein OXC91_12055 [Rhodobacteraceae bacterium]|nr:hypothetical protein [Paracoccaceae bacterium]